MVAQTRAAAISLAEYILEIHQTEILNQNNQSAEEMKKSLKGEFDRCGKAEVELEKASPFLDQHAPQIRDAARKIVSARPQIPDQPKGDSSPGTIG